MEKSVARKLLEIDQVHEPVLARPAEQQDVLIQRNRQYQAVVVIRMLADQVQAAGRVVDSYLPGAVTLEKGMQSCGISSFLAARSASGP